MRFLSPVLAAFCMDENIEENIYVEISTQISWR
jgi:hypothetical protein